MPTIELISIGCLQAPDLPQYSSFAYIADTKLVSHRALFQKVFDALTGVIVHLANKELEGDTTFWFAGKIMDWSHMDSCHDEALLFLPHTRRDVANLMQRLIAASPQRRITFSTDIQWELLPPSPQRRLITIAPGLQREVGDGQECGEVAFSEFFRLHDAHALKYNCLWYVRPDANGAL
jgi:hypothetical protein